MAVVISDFEVVPNPPKNDEQTGKNSDENKDSSKQPPTDYEVKKMLERRMERLERISAR